MIKEDILILTANEIGYMNSELKDNLERIQSVIYQMGADLSFNETIQEFCGKTSELSVSVEKYIEAIDAYTKYLFQLAENNQMVMVPPPEIRI